MPYISKEKREDLENLTAMLDASFIADAGELNYLITKLTHNYLKQCERQFGKPTYKAYNDAIGALESAKLELYRRKVIPYEEEKKKQNGDV